MRVMIAVHGFPPTHSAGAERRAERMAHWLLSHGHQVTVFTVERLDEPRFRVERRAQDGLDVYRLFVDVTGEGLSSDLYDYQPIGQAFRDALGAVPHDLVHVVSGYLLGGQVIHAAVAAGVPVVVTLTEFWFMCTRLNLTRANGTLCVGPESDAKCMRCLQEGRRRYRLLAARAPRLMNSFWALARPLPFAAHATRAVAARRETLRAALNAASLVVCPSRFLIDKFAEFGFETRAFMFMRQGLPAPPDAATPTPNERGGGLDLGYVGQIKPHKGVDLAVDAVVRLLDAGRQVRLHIWGRETEDPTYVSALKERSAAFPAIMWHGHYAGADVWSVLAGLDALVIPSRWYENSPNAILEAFAMRRPVIATNLGGMAELVQHERNGLVFDLDNVDDLRRQLDRLWTEPALLERLRAAIPEVKTIDEEMCELVDMYQSLVRQAPGFSHE